MRMVVGVLVLLAAAAHADPLRLDLLKERTHHENAEVRAAAAKQLADVVKIDSSAIAFAALAVISDDPQVRLPLLDALVARRIIPRSAAAFVPTEAVLSRMIKTLLPKRKAAELPELRTCSVVGGTARSAEVRCVYSHCRASIHERETFTFTTGVRWRVDASQRTATDDGTCGDVMMID